MDNQLNDKEIEKLVSDIIFFLPGLFKEFDIKPGEGWEQRLINALKEESSASSRLTTLAIELVIESKQWKEATKDIFNHPT